MHRGTIDAPCKLGRWGVTPASDGRHFDVSHDSSAWLSRLRIGLAGADARGDDPTWVKGAADDDFAATEGEADSGFGVLEQSAANEASVAVSADSGLFTVRFIEDEGRLAIHVEGEGVPGEEATLRADVEGGRHPVCARLEEGLEDVDLVGSRVKPYTGDPDKEVQQMASGFGVSALSDSVYDRYRDEALTVRGRRVRFGSRADGFSVAAQGPCGERPLCALQLRERLYGSELSSFAPLDRDAWPTPAVVWDSFYALGIYEFHADDVIANAEILARELKDYGFRYCLIDGGWQKAKIGGKWVPHNYGNWHEANDRFPGGMAALARRLRELGVSPALWFSVFATADDELYERHREWFLHDEQGNARLGTWIGDHVADLSHPGLLQHLRELYRKVNEEWGYEYLKLDGLAQVRELWRRNRAQAHDPSLSSEQAFRTALAAVRDAVRPDTFISGCRKELAGVGILHSTRLGTDTVDPGDEETLSFRGVRSVLEGMRLGYHLHNIAIYTDPDAFAIRAPLSDEEAMTWASVMALSGQMVTLGDDMRTLPAERLQVIRKILPIADVTPMDLYPVERDRAIWLLHVARPFGSWAVLGLFNWDYAAKELIDVDNEYADLFRALDCNDELLSEEHDWGVRWAMATNQELAIAENARLAALKHKPPGLRFLPIPSYAAPPSDRRIEVDFAKSGLEAGRPYALFDFWRQRFLGVVEDSHAVELPPHCCQVLSVRPATERPQVVGTDRHVTMGAVELQDESWEQDEAELSVAVQLIAGEPLTLTVRTAGRSMSAAEARAATLRTSSDGEQRTSSDEVELRTSAEGEIVRATLESQRCGIAVMRMRF